MAKDLRPFRKVLGKRVKGEKKNQVIKAGGDSLRSLGVNHPHPTFQKEKKNGIQKVLRGKKKRMCIVRGYQKVSCQTITGRPIQRGTWGALLQVAPKAKLC